MPEQYTRLADNVITALRSTVCWDGDPAFFASLQLSA
jgi:hypothetical protein